MHFFAFADKKEKRSGHTKQDSKGEDNPGQA